MICKNCKASVHEHEIYTDFYWCENCKKTLPIVKTQNFDNGWHKQVSPNEIFIWSDKWMENKIKNEKVKKE